MTGQGLQQGGRIADKQELSPRIMAKQRYREIMLLARSKDKARKNDAQTIMALRMLCQQDLFYLLVYALGRKDLDTDFHFRRCREIMAVPDGSLDLWARAHGKSSIITFGKTIQDILVNPERTFCIFSHTKPIARAFLRQLKYELETNNKLKKLFPDVLYAEPKKDSPRWSEEKGIVVKRQGNPKEATIEAHGLVDGQPTSRHYDVMIYDDTVTRESVSTPEMIEKVTEAWSLSLNLASGNAVQRYIGTRYHYADTYQTMMDRGSVIPRIYPCTIEGTWPGTPVLLTEEELAAKFRDMGSFVFAAQMLQDPLAGGDRTFRDSWLQWYNDLDTYGFNIYLVVDPANSKRKGSDYTVMWVIGAAPDGNYYLLDGLRDRLNLAERCKALFTLHQRWKPIAVGYEEYGMQSDIFYIRERQAKESYRFPIISLGGRVSKEDRIERLVPVFENGRMWLPEHLYYRTVEDNRRVDLVKDFLNKEYRCWPVPHHDDMLDCMARILEEDMNVRFPKLKESRDTLEERIKAAMLKQRHGASDIGVTPGGMAA